MLDKSLNYKHRCWINTRVQILRYFKLHYLKRWKIPMIWWAVLSPAIFVNETISQKNTVVLSKSSGLGIVPFFIWCITEVGSRELSNYRHKLYNEKRQNKIYVIHILWRTISSLHFVRVYVFVQSNSFARSSNLCVL